MVGLECSEQPDACVVSHERFHLFIIGRFSVLAG